MPGMILYIDEFEGRDLLERRFELDRVEVEKLLEGSGYGAPEGLVAEVTANRVGSTIRVTGVFQLSLIHI